jgi:hypothetical protein
VITGILYFTITEGNTSWGISKDLLVSVPVPEDMSSFLGLDFKRL